MSMEMQDAAPERNVHGGGPIRYIELAQDAPDVRLHGLLRDAQRGTNFTIAQAAAHQFQDLGLPGGEGRPRGSGGDLRLDLGADLGVRRRARRG